MQNKEITLSFDLELEEERRVYEALVQLPGFFNEEDRSKALIRFINALVTGISQCEQRKSKCEEILKAMVGSVPQGKQVWN